MSAEEKPTVLNDERVRRLEEVAGALESLRSDLSGTPDFDEARLDAYLKTALGATKAALGLATGLPAGDPETEEP